MDTPDASNSWQCSVPAAVDPTADFTPPHRHHHPLHDCHPGGNGGDEVLIFLIDALTVSPAKLHVLPCVLVEKLHQYLRLSQFTLATQRIGAVLVPLPAEGGRSPTSSSAADAADVDSDWGTCTPKPVPLGEGTGQLRKALRLENRRVLVLVTNDQAVAEEVRAAGGRGVRMIVIGAADPDSPLAKAASRFIPISEIITDFDMIEEKDYADDSAAGTGALVVHGAAEPAAAASALSSGVEWAVSSTSRGGTVALAHGSQLVARCRENAPLAIAAVSAALVAFFTALRESPQVNQVVRAAQDLFGAAADDAVERCSGVLVAAPSCARFQPLEPVSAAIRSAVEWMVAFLAEPVAS